MSEKNNPNRVPVTDSESQPRVPHHPVAYGSVHGGSAKDNPGDGTMIANNQQIRNRAILNLNNGFFDKLLFVNDFDRAVAQVRALAIDNNIISVEIYGHGGPGHFNLGYDEIDAGRWAEIMQYTTRDGILRFEGCAVGANYWVNKHESYNYALAASAASHRSVYAYTEVSNSNPWQAKLRSLLGMRSWDGKGQLFKGYTE